MGPRRTALLRRLLRPSAGSHFASSATASSSLPQVAASEASVASSSAPAQPDGEDLASRKRRIIVIRRQPARAAVRSACGFRSRTGWDGGARKANQDCVVAVVPVPGRDTFSLWAVLDGHGMNGERVSAAVAQAVVEGLERLLPLRGGGKNEVGRCLARACLAADRRVMEGREVECGMSGSTGVFCLLAGAVLYCANVGDSRAVLGRRVTVRSGVGKNVDGVFRQSAASRGGACCPITGMPMPMEPMEDGEGHGDGMGMARSGLGMARSASASVGIGSTAFEGMMGDQALFVSDRDDLSLRSDSSRLDDRQFSAFHDDPGLAQRMRRGTLDTSGQPAAHGYQAVPLSFDHNPQRPEEKARVLRCGGRIDMYEPLDNTAERVWLQESRVPGLAVTRSFGDCIVKDIGVIALPEIYALPLSVTDRFVILASDGVFEFISNAEVVTTVAGMRDRATPQEAAEEIVRMASERWTGSSIDDISCAVVYLDIQAPASGWPQNPSLVTVPLASLNQRTLTSSPAYADLSLDGMDPPAPGATAPVPGAAAPVPVAVAVPVAAPAAAVEDVLSSTSTSASGGVPAVSKGGDLGAAGMGQSGHSREAYSECCGCCVGDGSRSEVSGSEEDTSDVSAPSFGEGNHGGKLGDGPRILGPLQSSICP